MEEQNEELNKAVEETEEKRQCGHCGSITAYKFAVCSTCGKYSQSRNEKNAIWIIGIIFIIAMLLIMSDL